MEKEKKGLFGRLMDFWREKIGMGETDGIRFWHEKENVENYLSEMGAVAAISQKETERAFWEERKDHISAGTAEAAGILKKEKEYFSAEITKGTEEKIWTAAEEKKTRKGTEKRLFGEESETEKLSMGKGFLWEMPQEKKEKRSILPIREEMKMEEQVSETLMQQMPRKEAEPKRRMQTETGIDMEKLMREMTKRLWEERESCGRRLR